MSKSEYQKVTDSKQKAKKELFEKSWPQEDSSKLMRMPLLMVFAPQKEYVKKMFFRLLGGCLVLSCKIIVVSDAQPQGLRRHTRDKITWINPENESNITKIDECVLAADMALVFDERLNNLQELMTRGTVVIGHEKSPLLKNYHPNEETGNSFTYSTHDAWSIFMALVRANETYRFPYDWQHIVRGIVNPHC